jgi:quercetin dioxygenase-like cupin family protein
MSTHRTNQPLDVRPAPSEQADELEPLLSEPFAKAWDQPDPVADDAAVRGRLLVRLAASRAAEAGMVTARRSRLRKVQLGPGVSAQTLYAAIDEQATRLGEPVRVRLIELSAGAQLSGDLLGSEATLQGRHREWLVLAGSVERRGAAADEPLAQRDYHVTPVGAATPTWTSPEGALLFLRESEHVHAPGQSSLTVRDADAGWPDFAPGIQRRVLWQHDGQAALLYHAQPGAQVPHHTHGHDEECLMVQGELFLDDVLLQAGDYQLAPAGTGHRITETDTGVVIYAHGDLDLKFVG